MRVCTLGMERTVVVVDWEGIVGTGLKRSVENPLPIQVLWEIQELC